MVGSIRGSRKFESKGGEFAGAPSGRMGWQVGDVGLKP